jgi:hypothetical protein
MANYKRGKCRHQSSPHTSRTSNRKRAGLKPIKLPAGWHTLGVVIEWGDQFKGRKYNLGYPRWHDILYHTRPRRARERHCERAVMHCPSHADEIIWPLENRPHIYYW